jgi:hypothetical protein
MEIMGRILVLKFAESKLNKPYGRAQFIVKTDCFLMSLILFMRMSPSPINYGQLGQYGKYELRIQSLDGTIQKVNKIESLELVTVKQALLVK